MSMTSTTPSLSTRSSGNLQLALLTAMLPNVLGSHGRTIHFLDDFHHDSFVVCRGDCPGGFGSGLVFDQ